MINTNIINLAMGIMTAEGWNPKENSLTYRNHNPGALRSSPFSIDTSFDFAVFVNDQVGFFALCWDLAKKCRGETRTGLTPSSTLTDLVKTYTGEDLEEDIHDYLTVVVNYTGKDPATPLSFFN